MKTYKWILVAGCTLLILGSPIIGRADFGDEGEGVAVLLACGPNSPGSTFGGAVEYDPLAPERSTVSGESVPSALPSGLPILAIEIRNGSNHAISIPAKYDGKIVRLWGRSPGLIWPVYLLAGRESKTTDQVHLAPGERHTCFSQPLSETLNSNAARQRGWEWTWSAHPAPPFSPIHRMGSDDFVSMAVLWAEVVLDKQSLRSEPVIIKIKPRHSN